jgi:hypothetical protein
LSEIIGLRKPLENLYQKKDPECKIITKQQIAKIAPMWIDPRDHRQNMVIQVIIFLIPFMIFIGAIVMYRIYWNIAKDLFPGAYEINVWIYGGLYIISLLIFISCWGLIYLRLNRYLSEK